MSLTLKLQNPLTEEQLDSLLDVDFDHTNEVYFRTKHGKEVTFVKRQEPLTIHDPGAICPNCKWPLYPEDHPNYCGNCGRAVKWDGDI